MEVRDQETAELLRALIDEVRMLREQTTALLEAIVRKLEDISGRSRAEASRTTALS